MRFNSGDNYNDRHIAWTDTISQKYVPQKAMKSFADPGDRGTNFEVAHSSRFSLSSY